jgi:hypothetical protein
MTARGFNALARFFVNQPNPATNRIIGSLFLIGHALHPDNENGSENDIEYRFDDGTSPFSQTNETLDIVASALCSGSGGDLLVESQFA